MNTTLLSHGIDEEISDFRVHIGIIAKQAFLFPTRRLEELLAGNEYQEVPAMTNDLTTAMGFLIPIDDVPRLQTVSIPDYIMEQADFRDSDNTSEKGVKAVRVTKWLLANSRFRIGLNGYEVSDFDMQIDGIDITVKANIHIQVKCDWRAGSRTITGCTGNLFIETKSCNPYKMH